MSTRPRQGDVDAAVRCHYADDPVRRPQCALTAAVRYGTVALCSTCRAGRSSIGEGTPPVALPAQPQVDVLDWISTAQQHVTAAEHTLTAAVTRARQAGHPWSTIGALLGVSRQAAQQRFASHQPPAPRASTHESTTTATRAS